MAAGGRPAPPPLLPHLSSRKARAAALRGGTRLGIAAVALAVALLALSNVLSAGRQEGLYGARQQRDARLLVLAFYFPQYHPIPENAATYFANFSDWVLVRDAPDRNRLGAPVKKPVPPLGYYDPRDYPVRRAQGQMARDYGLDGFIYYHYWLENKLVMGEVLDRLLEDGQPDVPFALCWVNESWQRKFYGMERRVTFELRHDAAEAHAAYLARVFSSPLYLRVDGAPLLVVYRLSSSVDYIADLQRRVAALTGSGMFVVSCLQDNVESNAGMYGAAAPGAGAFLEFYPNLYWHDRGASICADHPQHGLTGELMPHPDVGLPVWRGGLTGWDPTPRYPNETQADRLILASGCPSNSSAEAFLEATASRLRGAACELAAAGGGDAVYALFAWNEWGEGAVMEPNSVDGHGLLYALARARREAARLHGEDVAGRRCRGGKGLPQRAAVRISVKGQP
ncbi:hypothetical protein Rsub_06900 [Raphidocelis subcapitata]|uniref:Glycosyltransferase n=1 Tax=Raphidocelis subcapitata TaxID=307507 RepID=A0A2V0P1Z5_9CHLO|nr:hypothetical protein Rsub_06900 [Raphidocelis subcapitata]|eukprot:GBF93901.1 hypothetical protein Rsub_06900 [Raphidocelis subcapitata]